MFWICDENGVGNTGMFYLLLNSVHALSRTLVFLILTSPVSRLGVHKKLGGDTTGTADPNQQKGYSILYEVMLSKKSSVEEGVQSYGVCLPRKSLTVMQPIFPEND